MSDELDSTARAFLKQGGEKITTMPGQTADLNRVEQQRQRVLIREACAHGDELIIYITGHRVSHTLPVMAWATSAFVLALRLEYPDGEKRFDEWSQRGGAELEVPPVSLSKPGAIHKLTPDEVFSAVELAKLCAKYASQILKRSGINNAQAAYGLGRAFQNLRLTFPQIYGGVLAFDQYAKEAGQYLLEDSRNQT